jgi:RNA polymerase sigma-70 factor (ECF subfamily)
MIEGTTEAIAQAQLLRRVAAGDRHALGELYDQIAAPLFSICFRIVGNQHDAEEVMQDVFVQIWSKAATFDAGLGAPFHWTAGIARNRAIDRVRSGKRRARLHEELQEVATGESAGPPHPATSDLAANELATVRQAVGALPADQRRALELAFFAGLSHAEIAGTTGEPLGTVKARIRRGLLKLRDTLRDYA